MSISAEVWPYGPPAETGRHQLTLLDVAGQVGGLGESRAAEKVA
ncbi:hypothetical protein N9X88_00015 [Alphaproteobacteria bacterium]|nr:hypothetical protein [Alphaproteobacteria bacterium]